MSILKVDTLQPATGSVVHAAGHVIQVVNGLLTTGIANNTASYIDSGFTDTNTPKFNTSKILVFVNLMSMENNTAVEGIHVKLVRASTDLSEWGKFMGYTRTYMTNHPSINYLDSPSTTSATVYKVQFKRSQGSGIANLGANGATSSMTLMEIAQ